MLTARERETPGRKERKTVERGGKNQRASKRSTDGERSKQRNKASTIGDSGSQLAGFFMHHDSDSLPPNIESCQQGIRFLETSRLAKKK